MRPHGASPSPDEDARDFAEADRALVGEQLATGGQPVGSPADARRWPPRKPGPPLEAESWAQTAAGAFVGASAAKFSTMCLTARSSPSW